MMFRSSAFLLLLKGFTMLVAGVWGCQINADGDWCALPIHQVIMVDAGSTGVRAVEYCFGSDRAGNSLELLSQSKMVEEGTPLTDSQSLTSKILDTVGNMHNQPGCGGMLTKQYFFMGGTAGLRTQSKLQKVGQQLEQAATDLRSVGVDARYGQNIRLLNGLEEAAFTWLAVNYLKKRLSWWKEHYGVIELGGGSVQKAYRIPGIAHHEKFFLFTALMPESRMAVYRFNMGQNASIRVYGESYLGFGLKQAYIRCEQANTNAPCSNRNTQEDNVYGHCREAMEGLFDTPGSRLDATDRDDDLEKMMPSTFYLNGYFYDRTTGIGLPEKMNVELVERAALYICSLAPEDLDKLYTSEEQVFSRFMQSENGDSIPDPMARNYDYSGPPREAPRAKLCADLTYISVLLRRLGMGPEKKLIAVKDMAYPGADNRFGLSWPLGYAIARANNWLSIETEQLMTLWHRQIIKGHTAGHVQNGSTGEP